MDVVIHRDPETPVLPFRDVALEAWDALPMAVDLLPSNGPSTIIRFSHQLTLIIELSRGGTCEKFRVHLGFRQRSVRSDRSIWHTIVPFMADFIVGVRGASDLRLGIPGWAWTHRRRAKLGPQPIAVEFVASWYIPRGLWCFVNTGLATSPYEQEMTFTNRRGKRSTCLRGTKVVKAKGARANNAVRAVRVKTRNAGMEAFTPFAPPLFSRA